MKRTQLNQFLHQISHEFQAQLTTLHSNLYLLSHSEQLSSLKSVTAQIKALEQQVMELSHLFDDLINIFLLSTFKQQLTPTNVAMVDFFQPIIDCFPRDAVRITIKPSIKDLANYQLKLLPPICDWLIKILIRYLKLFKTKSTKIFIEVVIAKQQVTITYNFATAVLPHQQKLKEIYEFTLKQACQALKIYCQLEEKNHQSKIWFKLNRL